MERASTFNFKLGDAKISVDVGKLVRKSAADTSDSTRTDILHYHAKHELFFIGNEPLTIFHEGGKETFSNCILCIPRFVRHRTVRSSGDTCMLFSHTPYTERKSSFGAFADEFFGKGEIFTFTTAIPLDTHIKELFSAAEQSTDLSNEAAIAALQLIFYNIMRTNTILSARHSNTKESYLIMIENIVNEKSTDPNEKIDLGTVAKELHLSRKQTARIIYKYYGTTLSELVNEKRLAVAELLLTTTDMPISQVAMHSGFSTDNYFFIKFKKSFGTSPLAYRNMRRGQR